MASEAIRNPQTDRATVAGFMGVFNNFDGFNVEKAVEEATKSRANG